MPTILSGFNWKSNITRLKPSIYWTFTGIHSQQYDICACPHNSSNTSSEWTNHNGKFTSHTLDFTHEDWICVCYQILAGLHFLSMFIDLRCKHLETDLGCEVCFFCGISWAGGENFGPFDAPKVAGEAEESYRNFTSDGQVVVSQGCTTDDRYMSSPWFLPNNGCWVISSSSVSSKKARGVLRSCGLWPCEPYYIILYLCQQSLYHLCQQSIISLVHPVPSPA